METNGFLYKSIILPIQQEGSYTVLGTLIYTLIAIALLFLIYKILKNHIKFDFKFFLQLVPFIFLGSSLRAFVDNIYISRNFWTISPGLYLLIAGIFFLGLALSLLIQKYKKISYWKTNFIIGSVLFVTSWLAVASNIKLGNGLVFFFCITTFAAISYLFYILFKKLKLKYFSNKLSFSAIKSQIFDGVNTSIILALVGGTEKHPIPKWIIEKTGISFIFLILKIIIAIIAVYLIYTQIKEKELRNMLLITIAVLGFAQGLRNLISLILT